VDRTGSDGVAPPYHRQRNDSRVVARQSQPHLETATGDHTRLGSLDLLYPTHQRGQGKVDATKHASVVSVGRRIPDPGEQAPGIGISLTLPVQTNGLFTGFKGYFTAELSDTVALDISGDDIPGGTTSTSWKHCFLPVAKPVPVRRHDRIVLTFSRTYPNGPRIWGSGTDGKDQSCMAPSR
jgi:hypothetical protein